jgi:hypothetical protein
MTDRRPVVLDSDPEIEAALAAGQYEVTADNYLTVADHELHREDGEWRWSDEVDAPMWRCPDGGVCHHGCKRACFRVLCCGPLSGVFVRDEWPLNVYQAHEQVDLEATPPRGWPRR